MRLAKECGFIPCRGHRARPSLFPNRWIKVDAIVMHPMRATQLPRQDRRPCRLADHRRCDARREMRSLGRELIQMRGFDVTPHKPETIGALLVSRNQKNIRARHDEVSFG